MANLPEKNIVTVSKVTSIPSNTNVFINANGEFVQANIDDVVSAGNQFKVFNGNLILAKGTSEGYATDFEGYGNSTQDGEPTPDAPIEISSVDVLEVKSTGKNQIKPTSTGRTINGVTFTKNDDDSWTVKGTATAANTFCNINYVNANTKSIPNGYYILTGGKDGVKIQAYQDGKWTNASMNGNQSTVTINSTTSNWLRLEVDNGVTVDTVIYPMLRPAEITDNAYEQYKENIVSIPLAEPLRGIGEVKDSVKKVDGLYGEGRKTLQIIYDGSESGWFKNTISNVPCFSIARPTNSIKGSKALCTHFVNVDTVTNNNAFTVGSSYVNFRNDDITTTADWKAWLAENPITVVMPISEEVFEPFVEQAPFYQIKTFDGVTLISSDAEMDVEVPMSRAGGVASIGYAKGNLAEIEMQNIKTKLTELQTAVVSA